MKLSFPRSHRLRARSDIEKVLHSGKRCKCAHTTFISLPGDNGFDRYAILVGRRHGNAVFRNHLKRTLRETIRKSQSSNEGPFYDILLCPRAGKVSKLEELKEEYILWKKQLRP